MTNPINNLYDFAGVGFTLFGSRHWKDFRRIAFGWY
jgi:hypothetical protein